MKRAIIPLIAIALLLPIVAADDWSIRVTSYGPNLNPLSGNTYATGTYNGYNLGYYQDHNTRYVNGYGSYGTPSFGLGFTRPTTINQHYYADRNFNQRTTSYGDWTLTQAGYSHPSAGINAWTSRTPYRSSWGDAATPSYSWGANFGTTPGYAPSNPWGTRSYSNPWSPYANYGTSYNYNPYGSTSYPRTTSARTSTGWPY